MTPWARPGPRRSSAEAQARRRRPGCAQAGGGGGGGGGGAGTAGGRAGLRQGRARAGSWEAAAAAAAAAWAGDRGDQRGRAPPRPAPARRAGGGRAARSPRRPSPSPRAAASEREPEPERDPELEPKLEPALRRTERSEAAKPIARYNRTSYFYPTFSESSEHSHLLVSPVLVASAVIGVVILLSCITIIVGSIRRDRQARLQRHRHRRRHHRRHHRHRRRHREYEHGHVSDGHTYSRSSRRVRYACSPAEDWPPPLDLSSDGDVDATVLRELYPDSPPGYEECVGPGATQLYLPTDAPPPYSLTDSCPALDGALDAGSDRSPGRHQQARRPRGQGGLCTVSMDTLPPYEAVCGASPPAGLLPLPGPGPGPKSWQGPPAPTRAPASGPERSV
ncbi:protein BEAN1 [Dasypus novemcinctus]|uniref:protein BEAN1 n=1 Tax=Dasypus novemcinctus TaxID=9361 RepID=UPI00265DCD34|nr:protein BEAN1 [Dasypus novemcinctus]